MFAFHPPQTGSAACGVRVRGLAEVVVGCGVTGCTLSMSPGIAVSDHDKERERRCPYVWVLQDFGELWLMKPRGQ